LLQAKFASICKLTDIAKLRLSCHLDLCSKKKFGLTLLIYCKVKEERAKGCFEGWIALILTQGG
jgi:hypothetical protein